MSFFYLGAILFSVVGMLVLDYRFKLAFFQRPRHAIISIAIGMLVFLLWDLFGIHLGIFFDGGSPFTTGLMVAPDLPIEEFFFLFFLCYFTLIVYRLGERRPWQHT